MLFLTPDMLPVYHRADRQNITVTQSTCARKYPQGHENMQTLHRKTRLKPFYQVNIQISSRISENVDLFVVNVSRIHPLVIMNNDDLDISVQTRWWTQKQTKSVILGILPSTCTGHQNTTILYKVLHVTTRPPPKIWFLQLYLEVLL